MVRLINERFRAPGEKRILNALLHSVRQARVVRRFCLFSLTSRFMSSGEKEGRGGGGLKADAKLLDVKIR